jgi:hypothetical protein
MDFRQAVPEGGSTSLVSIDVVTGAVSDLATGPGVKLAPTFVGNDVGYVRKDKPSGIAYANGKSGPQGHVLSASWSPDGLRVEYHKGTALPTPETTTGPKIWNRLPSYDLRLGGMQPSFDPSGVRYASADFVPTPEGNHLFVVDAETQKMTTIFHEPTRSALGPQWSAKATRSCSASARSARSSTDSTICSWARLIASMAVRNCDDQAGRYRASRT